MLAVWNEKKMLRLGLINMAVKSSGMKRAVREGNNWKNLHAIYKKTQINWVENSTIAISSLQMH